MTIYTFPPALWRLSSISMALMANSSSTPQSAWNGASFQSGPTTERWVASVSIVPQDEDDLRDVAALLRKLRGRTNYIRLYDPSRRLRGVGPGPTINVTADAAAGATSISVSGLTASQTIALAADDRFGIGENLYAISDDAPSDGSGNATLSFLPPLRQGVTDGDAITLPAASIESVTTPTGLFMLTNGGTAQTVLPGMISQPLNLEFVEVPDFE